MATFPESVDLTGNSVDIMNYIRQGASEVYKNSIPLAEPTTQSIREIGAIIMGTDALRNEFLTNLLDRISAVMITSKVYDNPWAFFKKGLLDFGEVVEEIFVELAKPFNYDPTDVVNTFAKREIPDVRTAFYVRNYKKYYKQTIENENLRSAFLSWNGISDLIAKIVESMYKSANYDEFQVMKYMLANWILDGKIAVVNLANKSVEDSAVMIKKVSGDMTFLSPDYNYAGVHTSTDYEDMYIISNTQFSAEMGVKVLAVSFHMEESKFMGHQVLVDDFGKLDMPRLKELLGSNPGFKEIAPSKLALLNQVSCVAVDKKFFMIFDNLSNFTENYFGEGMYWNYCYHVWKTFSISPFAQAVVFSSGDAPTVNSVAVTPTKANAVAGTISKIQLTAKVNTRGFAPTDVTWEVETEGNVTVDNTGMVTVHQNAVVKTYTVTAKSVFDNTKKASCMIVVSSPT